jgi:hypothetical protein
MKYFFIILGLVLIVGCEKSCDCWHMKLENDYVIVDNVSYRQYTIKSTCSGHTQNHFRINFVPDDEIFCFGFDFKYE